MIENPFASTRYYIDTEYDWRPDKGTITPISIGIVDDQGRELYAVSTAFRARSVGGWVKSVVLPLLPERLTTIRDSPRIQMESMAWMSPAEIRTAIRAFIGDSIPEFWGDYAAFDYVVLSMLMGDFDQWPREWPMHVNDLQQESIPSLPSKLAHHALWDARAVRESFTDATARVTA